MPTGSIKRPVRRPARPAASYSDEEKAEEAIESGEAEKPKAIYDEDLAASVVGKGWEGARKLKKEMPSGFAENFKPSEEGTIIKFLEDGPFASYYLHWCEWTPAKTRKGFVCVKSDCPLCDIGNQTRYQECHNIVDYTDPENPSNAVWTVGIKVSKRLENFNKEKKSSPINRDDLYFEVSRTGSVKEGTMNTDVWPVKARDLEDDFDRQPLTDEQLDKAKKNLATAKGTVPLVSRKELQEVADSVPE